MRFAGINFISITLCFVLLLHCCVRVAAADETRPFDAASIAPADVSTYVHVEEAAAMRRNLAERPIADWFNNVFESGEFFQAWTRLASAAGLSSTQLFDLCLGRRFTYLAGSDAQWVIVTEMDERAAGQLLQQLHVRMREPRSGMAVAELPEQEFIIARNGSVMVIGPSRHADLFMAVLPRIAEEGDHANALAARAELIRAARELGEGRIGVYMRHGGLLGGWSAAVADLAGDQLVIRHTAEFENAPFNHQVTSRTCDFSLALAFEDRALLTIMQPMDVGDSPLEAFLTASLGKGLISPQMRSNLKDRRLIVVGEHDGRQLEKPVDVLSATFAIGLEVNDAEPALQQLDRHMLHVARRISQVVDGSMLQPHQLPRCLASDELREVELPGVSEWFAGGFPVMQTVSLNWTVVQGPHGAWFVVASHRDSLQDVVKTLQGECPFNPRFSGKLDSVGVGNGLRIGRHLDSWIAHAEALAEPGRADELRQSLKMLSELASGLQRCHWQLARPSENEMRLEVQIELSPPGISRQQ